MDEKQSLEIMQTLKEIAEMQLKQLEQIRENRLKLILAMTPKTERPN